MYWLVLTRSSDISLRNTGNNFIGEYLQDGKTVFRAVYIPEFLLKDKRPLGLLCPLVCSGLQATFLALQLVLSSREQSCPHPCSLPVCTFLSSFPRCCCLASIKPVTPNSPQPVLLLPTAQPLYLELQPHGYSVLCLPPQIRSGPFPPTALPGFLQHSMEQPPLATCSLMY